MSEKDEKVTLRTRGPSFKIRSSTLSMLSLSKLSMGSEFEDDVNCTKQFTVLKIIILDIYFSLADHFTDFLQVKANIRSTLTWWFLNKAFNLIFGSPVEAGILAWNWASLEDQWYERYDPPTYHVKHNSVYQEVSMAWLSSCLTGLQGSSQSSTCWHFTGEG